MAAETEAGVQPATKDIEFWREREFSPLVNHDDLKKMTKDDPWQYEVASRLRNFLMRMESRKIVNFRVSGIVLHSASVLCRAKSQTMVDKGTEMQDSLADVADVENADLDSAVLANGLDQDHMPCTIDDLAFTPDGDINPDAITAGNIDIDKVLDAIAAGRGSMAKFLSREKLARFTMPKRIVAKPLTLTDLSTALNDALAGKFRRRVTRADVKQIVLPDAITKSYSDGLKIETLIPEIAGKVNASIAEFNKPVSFVELFDELSTIYIVKTFMSILHMINRKMIEVWQNGGGEILIVPFGKASLYFESQKGNTT